MILKIQKNIFLLLIKTLVAETATGAQLSIPASSLRSSACGTPVIRHSKRPRVGNQNDPTPEIEKTVDQQIEFVNPESLFLPANEFRR